MRCPHDSGSVATLRYGILGPLQVDDGAQTVQLTPGRQRLLLAVLLVHAGEAVTTDALIEALWDGEPPPSALRSLHNLVSNLRKALGDGVLVTEGRAYRLLVGLDELDAERFERLAEQGRLRDALALWRGPALGDLAGERAVRAEAARLEERRLTVLEDRIDADLAQGREAALVAELDSLVAANPLRERLRAQQMLALYRSGRQAEALRAYTDARHHLVSELGIEPGPALRELERAVLAQDPSLGAPVAVPARPHRRRRRAAIAVAALAAIGLAVAVAASGGPNEPPPKPKAAAAAAADVLAAIDPATNRVVATAPVGATPVSVTVGGGAAWSLSGDDMTLTRVDLRTRGVRTFATSGPPVDLAAGGGAVWVSQSRRGPRRAVSYDEVTTPASVARLDPASGTVRTTKPLPQPTRPVYRVPPGDLIAFGGGAAWVISRPDWLHRFDAATGHRTTLRSLGSERVATGDGQVWIVDRGHRLVQLDPRDGHRLARIDVAADWITGLAVGGGSVWLTDKTTGMLWRFDVRTRVALTIDVGEGVDSLAFGARAAWVGNSVRGTVTRVDAATNRASTPIAVGGSPRAVAFGDGRLWVGVSDVARSAPASGGLRTGARVKALSSPPCGPVVTGPDGDPDLLIASDLPLTGQQHVTEPMAAAVAFMLRRHGFRAGRFRLGVQSCDDATAQYGVFDEAKCAANARAYAANRAVVGVVGPLNSGCAAKMLPALEPAAVALISPTNSELGLVRDERHSGYARMWPSDDYVTAAGALAVKRLGGSVFFLEDAEYSANLGVRDWFRRAANAIDLRIAGSATFSVDATDYRRLAEQVRASGARVVYLNTNGAANLKQLLDDLRATLDPDVAFVGDSAMFPAGRLFDQIGSAARGLYGVNHVMSLEGLGAEGRAFVRAFAATQPDGHVTSVALYAAAATEVLLDAIAHSDGTRASIARRLTSTRLARSVLGPLAFADNGEPAVARVTFARLETREGDPSDLAGLEGTTVETVFTVPTALVR